MWNSNMINYLKLTMYHIKYSRPFAASN